MALFTLSLLTFSLGLLALMLPHLHAGASHSGTLAAAVAKAGPVAGTMAVIMSVAEKVDDALGLWRVNQGSLHNLVLVFFTLLLLSLCSVSVALGPWQVNHGSPHNLFASMFPAWVATMSPARGGGRAAGCSNTRPPPTSGAQDVCRFPAWQRLGLTAWSPNTCLFEI